MDIHYSSKGHIVSQLQESESAAPQIQELETRRGREGIWYQIEVCPGRII